MTENLTTIYLMQNKLLKTLICVCVCWGGGGGVIYGIPFGSWGQDITWEIILCHAPAAIFLFYFVFLYLTYLYFYVHLTGNMQRIQ